MPEEHDVVQIKGAQYLVKVFSKSGNFVPKRGLLGLPVSAHIHRDEPVAVVQVLATQLVLITVLVLANAVEGGVVAFQFALTFFLLPFALAAMPVATAVFPALSRSARDTEAFAATCARSIVAIALSSSGV